VGFIEIAVGLYFCTTPSYNFFMTQTNLFNSAFCIKQNELGNVSTAKTGKTQRRRPGPKSSRVSKRRMLLNKQKFYDIANKLEM